MSHISHTTLNEIFCAESKEHEAFRPFGDYEEPMQEDNDYCQDDFAGSPGAR